MSRFITALALGFLVCGPAAADDTVAAKLKGTWQIVKARQAGEPFEEPVGDTLTFDGDKLSAVVGGEAKTGTFELDATKTPHAIDMTPDEGGGTMKGLFQIAGDSMKMCLSRGDRPTTLESKPGEATMDFELKRK